MTTIQYFCISLLTLCMCFISIEANAGLGVINYSDSDTIQEPLYAFFDLRDRESFIQITNVAAEADLLHIEIFNVDLECNENDFFDLYTPNDTHVYNMRDILTNDGNPSGVVLPEDAYGIVVISSDMSDELLIGNLRIMDISGYEYRTNLLGSAAFGDSDTPISKYQFNFNSYAGVTLSDIVGISYRGVSGGITNPTEALALFDIDILNNNEVIFSCRNVIFACIDGDSPRQEEILEFASDNSSSSSSVARLEYGINDAIPHSRNGELLCPNNTVTEGFVSLNPILISGGGSIRFLGYVGLNNGNGRGSFDSITNPNSCLLGFTTGGVCGSL